jgi:hypothetical protein
MVDVAKSATGNSFEECGQSHSTTRRTWRSAAWGVEEDPELDAFGAHLSAFSTLWTTPEWLASAAGSLCMEQEGDEAKADRSSAGGADWG